MEAKSEITKEKLKKYFEQRNKRLDKCTGSSTLKEIKAFW